MAVVGDLSIRERRFAGSQRLKQAHPQGRRMDDFIRSILVTERRQNEA
jgi:hypothetical protein